MTNELTKYNSYKITNYDELEKIAKALAGSGYFKDVQTVSKAITKILAGQEFGFGPFASVNGIHIIQDKPAIGANLMAAAVKRSGRYDYRVARLDDAACEIKFYEHGEHIGTSTFTIDDARRAGSKNLDKFPRNMLFARAMSNGVRWFCPDVMNGSAVYTPEELGAETDDEGNVITVDFSDDIVESYDEQDRPQSFEEPYDEPAKTQTIQEINKSLGYEEEEDEEPKPGGFRSYKPRTGNPLEPDKLVEALHKKAAGLKNEVTAKQLSFASRLIDDNVDKTIPGTIAKVKQFLTGEQHLSRAEPNLIVAILDWLNPDPVNFQIDPIAKQELDKVVSRVNEGQPSII
ncbi:MAG TPA: hypothetical protein PLH63_02915 [Candidatus Cloacimonadota bacterium]|nr:hypothetical protein [Candidatus Cloacimonadota bacterium]